MNENDEVKESEVREVGKEELVPLEMRQKWDEILRREKAESELEVVKQYVASLMQEKTFLIGLIIVQNIFWLVILYYAIMD